MLFFHSFLIRGKSTMNLHLPQHIKYVYIEHMCNYYIYYPLTPEVPFYLNINCIYFYCISSIIFTKLRYMYFNKWKLGPVADFSIIIHTINTFFCIFIYVVISCVSSLNWCLIQLLWIDRKCPPSQVHMLMVCYPTCAIIVRWNMITLIH